MGEWRFWMMVSAMLAIGAVAGAAEDATVQGPMSPPWPRATAARLDLSFNRGWRFLRRPETPPPAPPQFVPPASARIKEGMFAQSIQPQDVSVGPHAARYVCLEALSAYHGPFASVAEFWLLDSAGKPLPRKGWRVAYVDSEEPGSSDFAINAIDGDPQTKWHSQWQRSEPGPPHRLVIDLGGKTAFSGFRYLARQDGNPSGMIKEWRFYALTAAPPSLGPAAPGQTDISDLRDATWEMVNLPHSVRLEPLNASGGRNYQGICWYRKHFPLNPEWERKRLYLVFEGAMQVADVWLNGRHLTTHYGGYLPFTVDISQAARFTGENTLTVRLDNSDNPEVPPAKPQNTLDFAYFGGLYRSVHLQVLEPLHIADPYLADRPAGGGVFVFYPEVTSGSATVRVRTDVANERASSAGCTVTNELIAPDGSIAATGTATRIVRGNGNLLFVHDLLVKNPRLWHPYHPYLYVLHTTVHEGAKVQDEEFTRIGIRTFRFDKDKGLLINGEQFFSVGANRHQDHPYVGYALPASAHYRDVKKLRDAGFTSYRSHYPQDPAFMDACDELGMLAIVSNPGWQFVGDDLFKQRVYQDAREMVRRDRNHPSVILWEAQLNESDNRSLAPTLYRVVHQEFPGKECYTAGDHVDPGPDFPGWDVDYGGNDGTKPLWIREWGDQVDNWGDQQSSSRVPRAWGETPMLVQAWSHLGRLDGVWNGMLGPHGALVGRVAGADLWAGIDCYRGYHHQPFYGGPLDLFRLPKFDYYMFQSQRPPDLHTPGVEGGPMVFIANMATFHSPSTVTVFSNCEEVRLTQNGHEVGVQKPDEGHHVPHPPFTFHVGQFSQEHSMLFSTGVASPGVEVGELKAEGLIAGKVVATQTVLPPGVPTQIVLEVDRSGRNLTADGSDWIRVYARLCDARGTTYPYGDDMVAFSVTGPGAIIGDAAIGANPTRAEAGIATALVRAGERPGLITVRAEAFGLKAGAITIQTIGDRSAYWP